MVYMTDIPALKPGNACMPIWPGAEFLLQSVAQLLPHPAGAVVGAQTVVLLNGLQLLVVEGYEHTVLLGRIGKDNDTTAVGGGRVDGKATGLHGINELTGGQRKGQPTIAER